MKKSISIIIVLLLINNISAQLLANLGQTIYSAENAIIKVEGSILNDTSGVINHNGLMVIDSSFFQNNGGTTQGFGEYQVYQDWDNSGTFIHDTSLVVLTGGNQNIQGSSVTDFYNLTLLGPGIKRQHINSEVSNILDLKANELATDSFEMFVSSPFVNAVKFNNIYQLEGFVSSLDIGRLKRATNTTSEYIYPLGSSVGIQRFRSVLITPVSTNINNYTAILINKAASLDGLNLSINDSTMCLLNDKFYHRVENTFGGDSAVLKISYDLSQDGYWDGQADWLAQWQKNSPNLVNTQANYSYVEKQNHQFDNPPVVLVTLKPTLTSLLGDSAICINDELTNYSVTGSGNFTWSVTNGAIISGQGTNSISVDWGLSSGGTVSVFSTNTTSGCNSITSIFNTVLLPVPTASFYASPLSPIYINTPINLIDSSIGASLWNWDFGNGQTSTNSNTQTAYSNNGTYTILLLVENEFGCTDTTSMEVVIGGKTIIPNIITPNGDGQNDFFEILGYDGKYKLIILNRWGQTLYEGNENTAFWDGTTLSGEETPEGTYFYVFTGEEKYLKKGTLTLFR